MNTSTPPPVQAPSDEQLLRLAIQNLACHPQAARRYVQMGWYARSVANLQRIGADLDAFVRDGRLDAETAAEVRALRDAVSAVLERRPNDLDEEAVSPRDYLFSNALEDEDWAAVRLQARKLHAHLSSDQFTFVAAR